MPQIKTKTKSKAGKPYRCCKCSAPIKAGQQYYEWCFYRSTPTRKHVTCGTPRSSETTSSRMSGVYAAAEGVSDDVEAARKSLDVSSLADTLRNAATDVDSVKDEYQDSWDNLGDNFQNGQPGEEIQEKIDALEQFAQELNDAADEIEGLDDTDGDYVDDACAAAENAADGLGI